MKKLFVLGFVAFVMVSVACQGAEMSPSGNAAGVNTKHMKVWNRMAEYRTSYLTTWSDAFDAGPTSAMEVLEAFNELGYAVTGPQGFWRKTVRAQWLGCNFDADTAACEAMDKAMPAMAEWDAFQREIAELDERKARRFLAKNHTRMMRYLDTYVPTAPSASEMKETAFFQQNLASSMSGL